MICVSGANIRRPFSCFITDAIPDLHIFDEGTQCFPLYWYEKNEPDQLSLFDNGKNEYKRRSGLSDFILQRAREEYGPKVTTEDVFYYVYGFLHSQEYRQRFSNNLKKGLARIHLVAATQDFKAIVKAGRKLAELHLGYETIKPYQSLIISGNTTNLNVSQMRFAKSNGEEDRSVILFNDTIKIENIPLRAYEWEVNGKSPIEWLMERYAVTLNKDSQIRNDPNDWCREQGNPRYILDLVGRIVNVSLQTLDIIKALPRLNFKTMGS